MSWFRRKDTSTEGPRVDPRIEMARQTNQKSGNGKEPKDGRKQPIEPGIIDSEFCYGGDTGPCA